MIIDVRVSKAPTILMVLGMSLKIIIWNNKDTTIFPAFSTRLMIWASSSCKALMVRHCDTAAINAKLSIPSLSKPHSAEKSPIYLDHHLIRKSTISIQFGVSRAPYLNIVFKFNCYWPCLNKAPCLNKEPRLNKVVFFSCNWPCLTKVPCLNKEPCLNRATLFKPCYLG